MQAEQALEKYLCKQVKLRGGMCIKLVGFNGIPDRLVVAGNKCVFVEMKTDGGRVAPIQAAIHKRLKKLGQSVYILWDYKQVDDFINTVFTQEVIKNAVTPVSSGRSTENRGKCENRVLVRYGARKNDYYPYRDTQIIGGP